MSNAVFLSGAFACARGKSERRLLESTIKLMGSSLGLCWMVISDTSAGEIQGNFTEALLDIHLHEGGHDLA